MVANPSSRHPTWTLSYTERASLPGTPALSSYILRLCDAKKTNLCVSADVTTSSELLDLAHEVGDQICAFKVHEDMISDWGLNTSRRLKSIARKKRFILFSDRKFSDIGGLFLPNILPRSQLTAPQKPSADNTSAAPSE